MGFLNHQQYCRKKKAHNTKDMFLKWFYYMGVSKNRGAPKSWILIGFSIINHPFWGFYPYFWVDTHICVLQRCNEIWFEATSLRLNSVDRWKRNQSWPYVATNRWPCSSSSLRAHGSDEDLVRQGGGWLWICYDIQQKKYDGSTHSKTHTLILYGYKNVNL